MTPFKMLVVYWILSLLALSLGSFIAIAQWVAIIQAGERQKANPNASGYSMIPLLGGVTGMIGCLLCPSQRIQSAWWIPLIVDPGCALLFTLLLAWACYTAGRSLRKK